MLGRSNCFRTEADGVCAFARGAKLEDAEALLSGFGLRSFGRKFRLFIVDLKWLLP